MDSTRGASNPRGTQPYLRVAHPTGHSIARVPRAPTGYIAAPVSHVGWTMTNPTIDLFAALQAALGPQYRLERELGRGGMGAVFLATDATLDRRVAIKVVHPELSAHPSITRRFLAEARTIARLRHPNVVAVHTAGSTDGLLYYVMDEVAGESLRQRLNRESRLDPALAGRIVADVAAALEAASRAGIVHRDVKPENVLLEAGSGRAM